MNATDMNFISPTEVYIQGMKEPTHLFLCYFALKIILSEYKKNPAIKKYQKKKGDGLSLLRMPFTESSYSRWLLNYLSTSVRLQSGDSNQSKRKMG